MTQHQLASSKTWKPTANIRVFIVSLILIFIFGIITFYFDISTLFQTSSSLTNPQIFPKEYEFSKSDPFRLITGSNYLKCDSLSALEKDVRYDLDHRIYVEQEYQQLHSQNNLFCGTARLSKKSLKYFFKHTLSGVPYKALEYDCIPKLTDAKHDLFRYIKSLCNSQATANSDHDSSLTKESLLQSEKRGVLYTGGVDHLKKIYESIYGMILLNISLPVEVWVNWEDHFVCRRVIGRLAQEYRRDDINCKILPTTTTSSSQSKSSHMGIAARKSFMCKFTALLSTSLTDVIFIDADNLPITSKVATLFDSEEYRATGAIIWPDIFGEKCRETQVRNKVVDPGITAWRSHCVLQAKMGGLKWDDTFPLAQEAETGQIVLNLRKHGALIEFAKVLMEHDFFRTVFYGDKDLFRYVFLLMEEPFYFVPHYPGLSVFLSDPSSVNSLRVDSLIQYFPSFTSASVSSTTQSNNGIPTRKPSEFEPYFFHQLKLRNPESFRKALLIAPEAHSKSSVCIQSTGCEIEVLDKMEHMLYRSLLLLSENSTSTLSRREFIRKRSLKATEIESSSSSSSSSSRSLQQTTELEKLYLQNLEKGEDYSHIAQQVFQKGDMDWHDIYTNSPWYRFALILHKIYGIFQAIYFQIDNYF